MLIRNEKPFKIIVVFILGNIGIFIHLKPNNLVLFLSKDTILTSLFMVILF